MAIARERLQNSIVALPESVLSTWMAELRAASPDGQPMPAGVLLDPQGILDRLPTLRRQVGELTPIGYHPRLGVFVVTELGKCERLPIRAPSATWCARDVELDEPLPFAEDKSEFLARLFAIARALAADHVFWVQVGAQRRPIERLDVDDDLVVVDLGCELLVGCRTRTALTRALEAASRGDLPVLPHAWGGDRLYSARGPASDEPHYDVVHGTERLTIGPIGDAIVWTSSSGPDVIRQRHVRAGRGLASRPATLRGASPRLLRHFGRLGAVEVDALRSVDGVRAWIDELGRPEWDVLAQIEEEAGGLILHPSWALDPPERIGPWIMHEDEECLAPLGLAESEDDPPAPPEPWPFVTTHGQSLAVIGLVYARFEDALCADTRGGIHYLDHEFASLEPMAETILGYFEKRALRAELFGDGFGIAYYPALAVPIALEDALLAELGLSRVAEASDAVSSNHVSDVAWASSCPEHPVRKAQTLLWSADAAFAVRAARAIREAHPDVPIHVRVGVDPVSAARGAAFDAAAIDGVVRKDWWTWGIR